MPINLNFTHTKNVLVRARDDVAPHLRPNSSWLGLLILGLFLTAALPARAATFVVTKTADTNDGVCDADCSLREAVAAANTASSDDMIVFDPATFSSSQSIVLTMGELLIVDNGVTVITGPGPTLLTIDGNNITRLFQVTGNNVTLENMTLIHGTGQGAMSNLGGGAIYHAGGRLTINNSVIRDNSAVNGGAIYDNSAGVSLNQCTITGNVATASNGSGGAILLMRGTEFVTDSTVSGNSASNGGAWGIQSATLNLSNSTVSGNHATNGGGGGINVAQLGTAVLTNCTLTGNSTTGGTPPNPGSGGAISSLGLIQLINCTVNSNTASLFGGGVSNKIGSNNGTFTARNCIIANNLASDGMDAYGPLISRGYNLIESTSGLSITDIITGNILGKDPMLLPLGNYGGPTATEALQPLSPAIDAGDPNQVISTDQRGISRPQDGDLNGVPAVDIGAYERKVVPFTVTQLTDTNSGSCSTDCSLREAFAAANEGTNIDYAILFDPALVSTTQSIDLQNGELVLLGGRTLVMNWVGTDHLTINAMQLSRDVTISMGAYAAFSGMAFTGGNGTGGAFSGSDGAIRNSGTLTLTNCIVSGNSAAVNAGGLGNYDGGLLTLIKSTIRANTAVSNQGGGIYNYHGTLILISSTVNNNSASGAGGGIANLSGSATMTNSTISSNTSTNGGGISTLAPSSIITVESSTITQNLSNNGGGVNNNTGFFIVRNSIVAANKLTSIGINPDIQGSVTSGGYNLIGNVTGAKIVGTITGNIYGQDPQLLPLNSYGGITESHLMRRSSPAIDKGNSFGSVVDQRGRIRPYDNPIFPNASGGDGTDIGAVELQAVDVRGQSDFDFDGDAKTDLAVFRQSDTNWYLLGSSNGAFSYTQFGAATDLIAPADYDGDGKADIAVFRSGNWYCLYSSDGSFHATQFGLAGDLPTPGDFDGDGKADIAVFRPTTGSWYVLQSRDGFLGVQFGVSGDKPVAADYDGDGRTDFGVYRDGAWYLLRSTAGFTGIQFGIANDLPVAGDYDGDGKADEAVFRQGVWYLLRSSTGFTGIQFGAAGDRPVPGDYDGDGRNDLAVFRGGAWYVLNSSDGAFSAHQFGQAGDIPVPSAFVP